MNNTESFSFHRHWVEMKEAMVMKVLTQWWNGRHQNTRHDEIYQTSEIINELNINWNRKMMSKEIWKTVNQKVCPLCEESAVHNGKNLGNGKFGARGRTMSDKILLRQISMLFMAADDKVHMRLSSIARTLPDVGGTEMLLSTRGRFVAGPTLTDLWTWDTKWHHLYHECFKFDFSSMMRWQCFFVQCPWSIFLL